MKKLAIWVGSLVVMLVSCRGIDAVETPQAIADKATFAEHPERVEGNPGAVIVARYVRPDCAAYWFEVLSVERFDKLTTAKPEFYDRFYNDFQKKSQTLDRYNLLEVEVGNTHWKDDHIASKMATLDWTLKTKLKQGSVYVLAWPTSMGVTSDGRRVEKKLGGVDGFGLQVFEHSKKTLMNIDALFAKAVKENNANHTQKIVPEKIDPSILAGTKVLISYYPFYRPKGARKLFDSALGKSGAKILRKYNNDQYLLLDCGEKDPQGIIEGVPYHDGAIIFKDGNAQKAFASYDGKKQVLKDCAVLFWGSTDAARRQMGLDIAMYSNMDGVVAKEVDMAPGLSVIGNPWRLELRPAEGKTLLEVFLWSHARFSNESGPSKKAMTGKGAN